MRLERQIVAAMQCLFSMLLHNAVSKSSDVECHTVERMDMERAATISWPEKGYRKKAALLFAELLLKIGC